MAGVSRRDIAAAAASALSHWQPDPAVRQVALGLDGFVDQIISVVEKRYSPTEIDTVPTIARLAEKMAHAIGHSANYELVIRKKKMGGNGPLMCMALAAAGAKCAYVGALGDPVVHEVFQPLVERAEIFSLADPAFTDALEFTDGKLMLGKLQTLLGLSWESLLQKPGLAVLVDLFQCSRLIGMVNWTMIPGMTSIWQGIADQVLPDLTGPRRYFFVDLADPEKRTTADLQAALAVLTRLQSGLDVVLGLNMKEAQQVAQCLGVPPISYLVEPTLAQQSKDLASGIRSKLGLHTVVVHPRQLAAAATAAGAWSIDGPFVQNPMLSTGAGDNFNGGYALGLLAGMSAAEALATGVATSGFYVRNGRPPTRPELVAFLNDLPEPAPSV